MFKHKLYFNIVFILSAIIPPPLISPLSPTVSVILSHPLLPAYITFHSHNTRNKRQTTQIQNIHIFTWMNYVAATCCNNFVIVSIFFRALYIRTSARKKTSYRPTASMMVKRKDDSIKEWERRREKERKTTQQFFHFRYLSFFSSEFFMKSKNDSIINSKMREKNVIKIRYILSSKQCVCKRILFFCYFLYIRLCGRNRENKEKKSPDTMQTYL